jgi:hypothetical protein
LAAGSPEPPPAQPVSVSVAAMVIAAAVVAVLGPRVNKRAVEQLAA